MLATLRQAQGDVSIVRTTSQLSGQRLNCQGDDSTVMVSLSNHDQPWLTTNTFLTIQHIIL